MIAGRRGLTRGAHRFKRAALAVVGTSALCVTSLATIPAAQADTAPLPTTPATPVTVSADALPTVQINGVVWSQVTVGDTVYATGSFTQARPAGSAAGQNVTTRSNLLAYSISTGKLITTFNHPLNAQGRFLAASPDGQRLYIGGDFTRVDNQTRNRIAAINLKTNTLDTAFKPSMNNRVLGITVSNDSTTIYAGGTFTSVNGSARQRLAAITSAGVLLPWAPNVADSQVAAVILSPDNTRLIAGGRFSTVNGVSARGLVALAPAPADGKTNQSWPAADQVYYVGGASGITSLRTDGTNIYGTAFVYFSGGGYGTLEGAFAADPDTGALKWVEDCHGDTYDTYTTGGIMYEVGHPHFCHNIGTYPQKVPYPLSSHRATAYDVNGQNTNGANTETGFPLPSYHSWDGTPAPTQLYWYPDLTAGTFTGQGQAAWSATGNANYIALGGEFPRVNGTAQQGLVRFAVQSIAPNKQGPRTAATLKPTALSKSQGTIRVRWQTTWDPDNQSLSYTLQRDGVAIYGPVAESSTFWQRPTMAFTDTTSGTHSYRVIVKDPFNNTVTSASTSATALAADPQTPAAYANDVVSDGASSYWRLGEASGSVGYDAIGDNDLIERSGVGHGATGPFTLDTDKASTFNGTTSGTAASTALDWGPNVFSVEAWFKTSSTSGGQIVGFGDSTTGSSTYHDRQVYITNDGQLNFVARYNLTFGVLNSAGPYNDGNWHHVVATMNSSGMALYVDGAPVGTNTFAMGHPYTGYWRIGGDDISFWPGTHTSSYLNGTIDDVAVYPTALDPTQVTQHYADRAN